MAGNEPPPQPSPPASPPVRRSLRILIAEDSPLFVEVLREVLGSEPEIEIVGVARDGVEALDLCQRLRPDLVVMDVQMPRLDGLGATELIMARVPTPILVMTADPFHDGVDLSLEALSAGALDLVPKPERFPLLPEQRRELLQKIRLLAEIPVIRHVRGRHRRPTPALAQVPPPVQAPHQARGPAADVAAPLLYVGIVASTGGPRALARLLRDLPPDLEASLLVVQHISEGFTAHLARWLDANCGLRVQEAGHGEWPRPGRVYLAPWARHLRLGPRGRLLVRPGEPVGGHLPSGDELLASLAAEAPQRSIGVVLSGMGEDGARGRTAAAGGRRADDGAGPRQRRDRQHAPGGRGPGGGAGRGRAPPDGTRDLRTASDDGRCSRRRRGRRAMRRGARWGTVERACELLAEWTGFQANSAAPKRISEFLARRAEAMGFARPADYLAHLEAQSPRAPEPQRLINLVTNGLTAFWRDGGQLEAVREAMSVAQRRAVTEGRPLAIWCAGCSTGEEPYTVSMIAAELGVEGLDILGTDVNTEALATAWRARYGSWSLRRLGAERVARFFENCGEGPEAFEVIESVRRLVRFGHHNLLDRTPAPRGTGRGWDLILCRNVLIYLRPQARAAILRQLAGSLHPEGALLLGAGEPLGDVVGMTGERVGEALIFRPRLAHVPIAREVALREPKGVPGAMALGEDADTETIDVVASGVVLDLLSGGRQALGAGDEEAALASFEAATCYDPFIPEAYCLVGRALQDQGAPRRALEAFRKALFLAPRHWLAAWEMGRLHEALGDRRRALRAYRQALEGLEGRRDEVDLRLLDEGPGRREVEGAARAAIARLG